VLLYDEQCIFAYKLFVESLKILLEGKEERQNDRAVVFGAGFDIIFLA